MSKYQQAKGSLNDYAIEIRKQFPTDKPAQRQALNDFADMLIRDYQLSQREQDWLCNYCCTLHPKK